MSRSLTFALLLLAGVCFFYAFTSFVRTAPSRQAPTLAVGRQPRLGSVQATVAVLDVGQGDAILIRSPEGKSALVDAGPSHDVVELLRAQGVTTLDLVVVTHHHADHYGGMIDVVRTFQPRVFLAPDSPHTSAHYLKLLRLVRDQGIQAIAPAASERAISLGSVTLTVFPQAPTDPHEENNNSIGIRLQYGGFTVLLPGDAQESERAFWEQSAAALCANCTVLKLAHHGSRNGTDLPWLKRVRPQLAIASVGAGNDYGHPHPETLALLAQLRIPLLRTDRDGTIVLQSDGTAWQVATSPSAPAAHPARAHQRSARHEKLAR
jgi:beta-lactamase superfamily II metal-dependent hydrolase